MLEIKNVTKTFPGVKALDGVSLTFNYGEIHALLGENGPFWCRRTGGYGQW